MATEPTQPDNIDQHEVIENLQEIREDAKQFSEADLKNGQWFFQLLLLVINSYEQNGEANYFQQKYFGLPNDQIADKLIAMTAKRAAISGAITGAAASTSEITTLISMGMTMPIFLGAIGVEMLYLARIQIRLVLELAIIYDLQIDINDPEDVMMVFGYALGVTPTDAMGKLIQVSAQTITKDSIKTYISKGTLKSIQEFGRRIGVKILQRTIIKYAVPIASMAVGSSYNYMTTQSLGKITKLHFRNREGVTEELQKLISRQYTYDLAFPAAAMYIAHIDGNMSHIEWEFYHAILSRLKLETHNQIEAQRLLKADETTILNEISQIEDHEIRKSLLDILILMAVYDGNLADAEKAFLIKVANLFNLPLDLTQVEKRTEEFRKVNKSIFDQTIKNLTKTSKQVNQSVVSTFQSTVEVTKQGAENLRNSSSAALESVINLKKSLRRQFR